MSIEVTGLLLAAGAGRRFGGPKALARHADGTPWLHTSVLALLDGGCREVIVVLGAAHQQAQELLLAQVLPERAAGRVLAVVAQDWEAGMSASLRCGLSAAGSLEPGPAQAVMVHLVDLPGVSADVVNRMLARVAADPDPARLVARAGYGGVPGHPVVFGLSRLSEVAARVTADAGARAFLAANRPLLIECSDVGSGDDIDVSPDVQGEPDGNQ